MTYFVNLFVIGIQICAFLVSAVNVEIDSSLKRNSMKNRVKVAYFVNLFAIKIQTCAFSLSITTAEVGNLLKLG